jgi:O-antigen/teichoic acid export membrane protein
MGSGLVKVLIRNAASNWLGFAVQAAVAFFLTPFVLASLGSSRYGVWMLVGSLTGYYGLLDLGFRAGLTQYLTRYLATGDYESLNKTASTGVVALACCGSLIFLAALALIGLAPIAFQIPDELLQEVRWAILINGSAVAIQFCLFPFSAVFAATQRYDVSNAIGISTRILGALGTYLALRLGNGIVGLSIVTAAANLLDYGLRWRLAYYILPRLQVSVRNAAMVYCWPLLSFGLWNLAVMGSIQLSAYSSEVLIALTLGAVAITPYALAVSLINYYANLFIPIGSIFFPAATQLDAQGRLAELRSLYLWGSRMLLVIAANAAVISAIWAPDFFSLWVGIDAITDGSLSPAVLFRVLIVGAACTATQRVGYQVFTGCRRLRLLAFLFLAEAILGTSLALGLIYRFGLFGMAVATVATACLFQGILHPYIISRLLRFNLRDYLHGVLLRSSATALILALACASLRAAWPIESWTILFIQGALALIAATVLTCLVCLDKSVRRSVFRRLLPTKPLSSEDLAPGTDPRTESNNRYRGSVTQEHVPVRAVSKPEFSSN